MYNSKMFLYYEKHEKYRITFYINSDLEHRAINDRHIKVFAQEDFTVKSNSYNNISLMCGVEIDKGHVMISLAENYKPSLNLLNSVVIESTDDIKITLYNNDKKDINIKKGDLLCCISTYNGVLNANYISHRDALEPVKEEQVRSQNDSGTKQKSDKESVKSLLSSIGEVIKETIYDEDNSDKAIFDFGKK
ncbi:TPA_asm: dUTPase [Hydra adintovirus]|nr:TPA_asm: dUTPase [Hydra adintovirus]